MIPGDRRAIYDDEAKVHTLKMAEKENTNDWAPLSCHSGSKPLISSFAKEKVQFLTSLSYSYEVVDIVSLNQSLKWYVEK